jgi:hypothetical protein
MYQVPPHQSASTAVTIAALAVVVLMCLAFSLSVTDLGRDGVDLIPRPLPAGATLHLPPALGDAVGRSGS